MANSEFLEVVTEVQFDILSRTKKEIREIAKEINKANDSAKNLKIPSDFRSSISQLNDIFKSTNTVLKEQVRLQQEISSNTQRSTTSLRENTTAAIDRERVERERIKTERERIRLSRDLETQEERQRRSAERLGSAYLQLSRQQSESARRVQDLIVRGRQATQTQREYDLELRVAQREFDGLNRRVLAADTAVGRFNRNVGNYPAAAVRGLRDLVAAFGLVGGVTAFALIAKDIFNTTRELQSLDLALKQVVGSNEEFAKSQTFIQRISEAYGVEVKGLQRSYTSFFAAAKNSIDEGKITATQIKEIFEIVSKASGAMGLSAEQQQGAFLAIQQMISKGNVQAEEIRGQLAERLPGAFGILAKSMGVSEVQLNKLLKDGKVLAYEVLPAFAKELEKAYGVDNLERVESITAETTRLSNEWTNLIRTFSDGEGVISKSLIGTLNLIKSIVGGVNLIAGGERGRDENAQSMMRNAALKQQAQYYQDLKKEIGEVAALEKARNDTDYFNEKIAMLEAERRALLANIKVQKDIASSSTKVVFGIPIPNIPAMAKAEKTIRSQSNALRENAEEIGKMQGALEAAKDLNPDDTKYSGAGSGKTKRQKADIDWLHDVYELRKQNTEREISDNNRIMTDEEINYERRFKAASNYYSLKKDAIQADYEESIRLNNLDASNQSEIYRTAIAEGKATSDNLEQIEYRRFQREEKIKSEYRQKNSDNDIESAKNLMGVLEGIQDQYQKNLISKGQVDNLRQAGLILGNVGAGTTLKQFADIENQMRKLAESEKDGQLKALEIDLRRNQAQQERLVGINGVITDNAAYNKLKENELKLEQQILDITNARKKAVADLTRQMKESTQQYLNTFTQGVFSEAGLSTLGDLFKKETYEIVNSLGEIDTKYASTFDKMIDQAGTLTEKFAVSFNAITEVAQEAYNFLNSQQDAYYQRRYEVLARDKEISLGFVKGNAAAEEEINRQYAEKRRELELKELKAKKEQAIFNAIINTAQGVTAAIADANYALAIIVAALGAAQIALISSQEIPQYAEGVMGHKGGLAVVGDGGRSEIVQTPSGGLFRTPATDTLVNLPKGSNVYKSEADFLRNSGTLLGGVPHIKQEQGFDINALDSVMGKYMKNAASNNIIFDGKGFKAYTSKGHTRNISMNNRILGKGTTFN